jgi:hypothetical protein
VNNKLYNLMRKQGSVNDESDLDIPTNPSMLEFQDTQYEVTAYRWAIVVV